MKHTVIDRVSVDTATAEAVTGKFTNHVHKAMGEMLNVRLRQAELARKAAEPVLGLIKTDVEAFRAFQEFGNGRISPDVPLRKAPVARLSATAAPSLTAIGPGGLTIIGPPFDLPWTDARGNLHGSRYADGSTGSFGFNTGSVTGDWSSQSAGMGVLITASTPVNVQITPDASFDYAWADTAALVTSHTSGLVGVLIQDVDGTGSIEDIRQNLWSDGTGWFESHDGGGNGFVQNLISAVNLSMIPGHRYAIWTWAWGESDGNLASCRLDGRLFVLAVSALPS